MAAVVIVLAVVSLWKNLSARDHHVASVDESDGIEKIDPKGPAFSADTAYMFCEQQCQFGPRTMNSTAHEQCRQWIVKTFQELGCEVVQQEAVLNGYDGTALKSTNIIARSLPALTDRILVCAHWDSRPWADNDPDEANWKTPVLAANDGASGVAVMLELARLLQQVPAGVGVDFVALDAEDWGVPQWENRQDGDDTWALGAQYFAEHVPEGMTPRYGVLLDMVGGQGAQFFVEYFSRQYAPDIVKKVWKASRRAGYGSFFPQKNGGAITDDHIPLNRVAGIPTVDIIPYYPDCQQSSFGPTWHTVSDDMAHIDRATLKAVGQTMVQLIYTEK